MSQVFEILLSRFDLFSLLDILLVTILFYALLTVLRGTRAVALLRGLFIVFLLILVIRAALDLTTLGWLLDNVLPALIVTIPVVFQPELRRALESLGQTGPWSRRPWSTSATQEIYQTIQEVAAACKDMSRQRVGALIVMERTIRLDEYAEGATYLDARLSRQLLLDIFYPNSPLHDGAALVRKSRILAAASVLPLSEDILDSYQYGTRHRAAIGISEQTDAVAVVVSEETGVISVAQKGRIVRWLDQEKLIGLLKALFYVEEDSSNQRRRRR
jgi:uncharacterized protein (TIGR00159 family)